MSFELHTILVSDNINYDNAKFRNGNEIINSFCIKELYCVQTVLVVMNVNEKFKTECSKVEQVL